MILVAVHTHSHEPTLISPTDKTFPSSLRNLTDMFSLTHEVTYIVFGCLAFHFLLAAEVIISVSVIAVMVAILMS